MKLTKLILKNVGLFRGKHEFDLATDSTYTQAKPVILFGGLNGSGKTTIFESVKLCLYGKDVFPGLSEKKYRDYLINKIHHANSLPVQPGHAAVEVEFQYSRYGEVHTYSVSREWEKNGSKVDEILDLKADGKPVDEVYKENWQDFIKELIPPGLTRLFFFDGEKVQKVMENNNIEFKNSIKRFLGLDIIERLQADLKIYKTKNLKEVSPKEYYDEMEKLRDGIDVLEKKIDEKRAHLAALENEILKNENSLNDYQQKIAAQGEGFLRKKDQLAVEKRTVEKQIEVVGEQIKEIASGLLPLCIAANYSKKLKEQLSKERELLVNRAAEEKFNEKKGDLLKKLYNLNVFAATGSNVKEAITGFLEDEFAGLFRNDTGSETKEIFGFSSSQTNMALSAVDMALNNLPASLEKLTAAYEKNFRNLEKIHSELAKAPDEELIKPMFETLNALNQKKGELVNERSHYHEEISKLSREIEELRRREEKIEQKIEVNRKKIVKIDLVNKAQHVLSVYRRELALKKVDNFKQEFLSIFNDLHRKRDLIGSIDIDPDHFDIRLLDNNKKLIPKELLSSGEKELYAVSLLTALTRVSGQNLPFLIDMPLGRLDKQHRDLVINNFIPYASHQMILFSTNSEIDRGLFDVLTPYISRSYSLEYDNEENQTLVKERYFWK